MAGLHVKGVTKRFGALAAVDRVDLDLGQGEFLAVLGPSGCGKTTLLRLVAGFETPDEGAISIGGREVAGNGVDVPPEERRVGIVFQSYALWPHMDVRRNVGYPLEVAGVRGAEYAARVGAALATVGLDGLGERRPAHLSGGQRQRVALARCLVMEPALVLLDEPLANLDVHLRAAMLDEFASFHDKTGATMVYITHDQAEAMTLADRIAVMDDGRVQQIATPRALYREPATAMVGAFIGQGTMVHARVLAPAGDGPVQEGWAEVELLGLTARLRCPPGQIPGEALVCLRPESLEPAASGTPGTLTARIMRATYKGGRIEIDARAEAAPEISLRLHVADGMRVRADERLALRIVDGWVIPGAG